MTRQSLSPTSCRRSPNSAAARHPPQIDGIDFSPTLLGNDQPELSDRFLYWEFGKFGVYSQAARWNQLEGRSRSQHQKR